VRSSIKFGGARRVLFLVDRSNLGEQARAERATRTANDGKKTRIHKNL